MNEPKQTAVDFLIEKLFEKGFDTTRVIPDIEQAKEMERQQIIDAYWGGLNGTINDYSQSKTHVNGNIIDIKIGGGAEQYYNQNYQKDK